MGALTIAFDITIVGALAPPWVVLVLHLLFFEGENRLGGIKTQTSMHPAAAKRRHSLARGVSPG